MDVTATQVIYDNTCFSGGYFIAQSTGQVHTDEGRVPSPNGPLWHFPGDFNEFNAAPGCQSTYQIGGFQVAYCTREPVFDALIGFEDSYPFCASPAPDHMFALNGLPASATGLEACWTVTVDLAGTGQEFNLPADGNGSYGPPLESNYFGYSFSITSPVANPNGTGELLAGNSSSCPMTGGTVWGNPGIDGTGMSTSVVFRLDNSPLYPSGCYIAPDPFTFSFHLQLYADPQCPDEPGRPYCFGVTYSGNYCPCGNIGDPLSGCPNSQSPTGAHLSGSGDTSPDSVVLSATDLPSTATTIFLQGTVAGTQSPFGDGYRCITGTLLRLAVKPSQLGTAVYPVQGDPSITARSAALGDPIQAGTSRFYQVWYRDPSPTFCPPSTYNITSGYWIRW